MAEGASRKIDPEFRQILLELTIEYMSQNPPDFLDFALDFFNRKHAEQISAIKDFELSLEHFEDDVGDEMFLRRRESFRAESFDPSQLVLTNTEIYQKSDLQKAKLRNALDKIVLFVTVLEEDRNYLVDIMKEKTVRKGEVVIKEGEVGDYFYVVESGKYEAFKIIDGKKEVLKTYNNEGYFGELALLHDAPRASTVEALSDGVLWSIDRTTFRNVVVVAEYQRTKLYEELLGKVPLLVGLTQDQRRTLADTLIPRVYKSGQRLICEGEVADGMYFMVNGTARVVVSREQQGEMEIKTLTTGDYFGELALITHRPRAASVYAVDRVQAAFLEMDAFERLLGPCIDLMEKKAKLYDQEVKQLTFSSEEIN